MERQTPQDPITKTVAALAGVLAIGLFVASQEVAPIEATTDDATPQAEALPAAGYFPAQFRVKHAADASADPIPTF